VVHGDGQRCHLLPGGAGDAGLQRLFGLFANLHARPVDSPATLADALSHLRRLARPGSLMLILGDFTLLDGAVRRHLAHLARHGEMAAIHIFDPLERELPPAGIYPLSDGRGRCSGLLDTSDAALRQRWRVRFSEQHGRVAACFSRLGARTLLLGTEEPLLATLRAQLRPQAA
jgi:hypothetical protein